MNARPCIVVLDDWEHGLEQLIDWVPIKARADVRILAEPLRGAQLHNMLKPAQVLVLNRDRTPLTADLIHQLPALRHVIHTGPRNLAIDHAALAARGIAVSPTAGGPALAGTCEHTWALILALSRRLETQMAVTRSGGWRPPGGMLLPSTLEGETLGLIGCGHIGGRVAAVGRAFGMSVVTWSPHMTPERAAEHGAEAVSLPTLLARSKVVSLHLAATATSPAVLDAAALPRMRQDALLINTSRARLVDMDALLDALANQRIAGAALDVFPLEPLPENDPLRALPNVVLTPHIGFLSREVFQAFASGVEEALRLWLDREADTSSPR